MSVAKQFQDGSYKVYVPTNKDGATDIKYEFYYSKGGMNYISGDINRRGYYLSAVPVTRTQNELSDGTKYSSESMSIFSGIKQFLNDDEIARKSNKAEKEARDSITEDMINTLTGVIGG